MADGRHFPATNPSLKVGPATAFLHWYPSFNCLVIVIIVVVVVVVVVVVAVAVVAPDAPGRFGTKGALNRST